MQAGAPVADAPVMKRIAALLFFAACASTPSGASCPTANAPTYDSFGQRFFTTYCTSCHSRDAADRHGAPGDQNYDTEADIRQHAASIDLEAAAGPKATNTSMPDMSGPVHVQPSDVERQQLGEFLACEQQ
jgi:uncharacterized membrane protein